MDGRFGMSMNDHLLLADIGNTYFHIYDGNSIQHLLYDNAIDQYKNQTLYYISVKHELVEKIEKISNWKNISSWIHIEGEYNSMGVDRKALCLSHIEGVFIDAGSAITVDFVEDGKYQGGFILPGIKAYMKSYKAISSALDTGLNASLSLKDLPTTTKDGISYGIIASIKALIEQHRDGKPLYFTGGDARFLSSFFEDVICDEMLVFEGIKKAIKNKG